MYRYANKEYLFVMEIYSEHLLVQINVSAFYFSQLQTKKDSYPAAIHTTV
jgi:hypothetical protein